MKARYSQWEKLLGPLKHKSVRPPIRVLDLPGVQRLEDKLLLNGFPRRDLLPETEQLADETSIRLFGITKAQTEIYLDDFRDYDDEDFEQRLLRLQRASETVDVSDEDRVEVLLNLGLDFRGQRGHPLLCTRLFGRQAEAAAKRIIGNLPDQASAHLQKWESNLERDAEAWKKRKSGERT